MAGFCPYGKECKEGAHARFPKELKKPVVMGTEVEEQEESLERPPEAAFDSDSVDGRFERDDRGGQKFGRGKWQPRGGKPRGGFKRRAG
jgi:cleavage and polyadenylation specificity factor subunit 4